MLSQGVVTDTTLIGNPFVVAIGATPKARGTPEHRRKAHEKAKASIYNGSLVSFNLRGVQVIGRVTRRNPKRARVKVLSTQIEYTVAYEQLSRYSESRGD